MQRLKDDHVLDGSSIPSVRGGKRRKISSANNDEYLTTMNETNGQMATFNVTILARKITDVEDNVMNIRQQMWQMEQDQAPEEHIDYECLKEAKKRRPGMLGCIVVNLLAISWTATWHCP